MLNAPCLMFDAQYSGSVYLMTTMLEVSCDAAGGAGAEAEAE